MDLHATGRNVVCFRNDDAAISLHHGDRPNDPDAWVLTAAFLDALNQIHACAPSPS